LDKTLVCSGRCACCTSDARSCGCLEHSEAPSMMQPNCDSLCAPRAERAIRVLVADDHPLTRLGIRHALGDGFEVCAEADDAEAAVAAAQREQPDICLLDVRMPGNGIQAAARISAEVPRAAIVMISAAGDHDTLLAA